MKYASLAVAAFLLLALPAVSPATTYTDGIYQLSEVTNTWEGTDAVFPAAPSADYDALLGDDVTLTYTLPASFSGFTFYRQPYTQITVDTNGSIWFGNTNSTYVFSLGITGKGPVISPWHNDLSSYLYGGVFIQHKTDPERVVIEWQTETYRDEGEFLLNNFEAVLFPDGTIRIDYKDFPVSTAPDSGSGISNDDGTHFLSLTANYADVPSLAGRSFLFEISIPKHTLSLLFNGSGSGTITSDPVGIACNTNCSALFYEDTTVTLHQTPHYSIFNGWSNGDCSGTGDCQLSLTADRSITATYTYDSEHQVQVGDGAPTYYSSLQAAYNAVADSSTLKLWATTYTESLTCNRPITVTLHGGYDSGYTSIVGEPVLSGELTISDGTVISDGLVIK